MKSRLLILTVLLALSQSARAQQPANVNPLSTYLQRSYAAVAKDLVALVATMPEQDFGFRPAGAVNEVRTFGQIVSHLVLVNAFVCAMGDGLPDPPVPGSGAPPEDKPGLIAMIERTNARCTAYLATVTDAALTEVITTGTPGPRMKAVRGNSIVFAIAHSNEHYGNLVTYLRANGLVPPASASQAGWISPVTPPAP